MFPFQLPLPPPTSKTCCGPKEWWRADALEVVPASRLPYETVRIDMAVGGDTCSARKVEFPVPTYTRLKHPIRCSPGEEVLWRSDLFKTVGWNLVIP